MGYTSYVQKYLDYCKKQKDLDAKTVKAYRIDLRQFVAKLEQTEEEISKESVLAYISYLNEQFKPRSVKRKIASLKAFCGYLCEEHLLSDNPFQSIRLKLPPARTLPRVIPLRVIEAMLCEAHRQTHLAKTETGRQLALRESAVMELLFAI